MSSSEGFSQRPIKTQESREEPPAADTFNQDLLMLMSGLRRYAHFLTKHSEDADDLTQETLRKALEHKQDFQSGTDMKAWLTTLMRNAFTSSTRLASNRLNYKGDPEELFDYMAVEDNKEAKMDLKKALQFMDEGGVSLSQKQALEMLVSGHEYTEIAKKMHIREGTAKTHVKRARQKLNEQFKDES